MTVLLLAADDRFATTPYLLRPVLARWREEGVAIDVVCSLDALPRDGIVVPHLDVTVMPPAYRTALVARPAALNRRVVSIAKSALPRRVLVRPGEGWDGPVIVKTDCNYGGLPEQRLQASRSLRARIGNAIARLRGPSRAVAWDRVTTLRPDRYPVFDSVAAVPPAVFANDRLVVERFLPELADGDYCVRYLYCLGDRELQLRLRSRLPVVKGSAAHACEALPTIPVEIQALRRRIGLDYGKLDYVVHEREGVVLLDVNRTPATSVLRKFALLERVVEHLAPGIHAA